MGVGRDGYVGFGADGLVIPVSAAVRHRQSLSEAVSVIGRTLNLFGCRLTSPWKTLSRGKWLRLGHRAPIGRALAGSSGGPASALAVVTESRGGIVMNTRAWKVDSADDLAADEPTQQSASNGPV